MNLAIFDVDGTLLQNHTCEDECYATALREVLRLTALDGDWAKYANVSDAGIAMEAFHRQFGLEPSPEQLEATIAHFVALLEAAFRADSASIAPVAGAEQILPALVKRGWAVAIATGAWSRAAQFKLSAAGVHRSGVPIATSEDGPARGAIILSAVSRAERLHGLDSFSRVVSVGDAVWDVSAARALDIAFVGVGNGTRAERLYSAGARVVIGDFADMAAVLDALETAAIPRSGTV